MTTTYFNWDNTLTATSIASTTIANAASSETAVIDNDLKVSTEISVKVIYGTATGGVKVFVLRNTDSTNYESITTDSPFGFELPYTSAGTIRRSFTVSGDRISKFKISLKNESGADATCSVNYRQCVSKSV